MAEQEQNRSEAPSAYKLMRARRQGQVARGLDLGFFTALCAFLAYAWISGERLISTLARSMRDAFISSAQLAGDRDTIFAVIGLLGSRIEGPVATFATSIFVLVLLLELLQTGIVFSSEPLKLDFSRLNPAQGLKRLFSIRLLLETAKNLLKLALYSIAAWLIVRNMLHSDVASIQDAASLAHVMTHSAMRFLEIFAALALLFAAIDQLIARRGFLKRMRMSRREMKQEVRDREGEPRLKQKRKQMHAEFVRNSRSMKGLRGADMLIVNPLHIAVALRYDPRSMVAPTVVAVGVNQLALRLKRLAFLYGIPVVEDRVLARSLLRSAAVGHAIPATSFQPVADIYNRLRRQRRRQEK
ncbi:MAG TPA: EscU/YscU/HrcU family type III secretion system export apparatus switch protein [Acetobacteraceae bacterium]|nr:EscU/YscU/HrcU family type III secretion system export apparatus switch protein [Acetobacteraceae bacterium]